MQKKHSSLRERDYCSIFIDGYYYLHFTDKETEVQCELHKATLLRKLLFKPLVTFPLSDTPQLAQKRVWVGDAVGKGENAH